MSFSVDKSAEKSSCLQRSMTAPSDGRRSQGETSASGDGTIAQSPAKAHRSVEQMMRLEESTPTSELESSKSFNNMAKKKATAEGFQQMMVRLLSISYPCAVCDSAALKLPRRFSLASSHLSLWQTLQSNLQRSKTTRLERQKMLDDIKSQADRYREQIRKSNRLTIAPHSKHMQRWDILTTFALLFTATVTPFEVGLLEPLSLAAMMTSPLAWTNRVVDVIFLTDIVLNCFLSYQELGEHGGAWIHDNKKIFMRCEQHPPGGVASSPFRILAPSAL